MSSGLEEGSGGATELQRRDEEGCLVADVVADAFCYSMVRNLVGAIVCVADGRKDPAWI